MRQRAPGLAGWLVYLVSSKSMRDPVSNVKRGWKAPEVQHARLYFGYIPKCIQTPSPNLPPTHRGRVEGERENIRDRDKRYCVIL